MAVTVSGLYVTNFLAIFNATQLAFAPIADTVKCAMFTNSLTPNFSTDTTYSVTNEVSGTGYTAAGNALTTKTISESPTGSMMFDADDVSWTTSTITNARCALIHDTTITKAICLVNFGSDFSTTAGTFTIQWAATGIFAIDLTP